MRRPVRILHLDDNPIDAQLVALTLEVEEEKLPTSITYVQTRGEFLSALERKDFDLILSDYRMPGYDGDQALAAAQEKCPEIPFIMVTGELGEELVIETLKRGATDYVLKDRIFRLIPAIERALDEAENEKRRLEAERCLHESEERFHTMADNLPQLAWIADEKGQFVWCNKRWYDYTGATPEEIGGSGWQKLPHPEHVERVAERYCNAVEKGALWEDTFPMLGKDGAYRWFLSRAIPIKNEHGKVIRWFGTNTDITEQRKVKERLDRARRTTQAILKSVHYPLFSLDDTWRFTYVNKQAEESLGKNRKALLGKIIWEVFPQLAGTESEQTLRTAARTQTPLHYEGKFALDTRWLEVHFFPRPDGGVSILYRDISERKKQEEALHLSMERFAATFRASPYPLALSRLADGELYDVNDALLALFGTTRDQIIGRTSLELGIWPDAGSRNQLVELLKRDGHVHKFPVHFGNCTLGEHPVLLSATLVTVGDEQMMLTAVNHIT